MKGADPATSDRDDSASEDDSTWQGYQCLDGSGDNPESSSTPRSQTAIMAELKDLLQTARIRLKELDEASRRNLSSDSSYVESINFLTIPIASIPLTKLMEHHYLLHEEIDNIKDLGPAQRSTDPGSRHLVDGSSGGFRPSASSFVPRANAAVGEGLQVISTRRDGYTDACIVCTVCWAAFGYTGRHNNHCSRTCAGIVSKNVPSILQIPTADAKFKQGWPFFLILDAQLYSTNGK